MDVFYSTITEKGQVTLPAELRHKLGFLPGLRVAMREEGDTIVVGPVQSIAALRERAKAEMQAAGTWGKIVDASDGWAAAAAEKYGERHGQS